MPRNSVTNIMPTLSSHSSRLTRPRISPGLARIIAAQTTPVAGDAASYILARTLDEGLSTDKAKQIVAGIQFAHDVSERYINSSILKAALAFMAQIDVDEAATVAESVAELELPKTNGNGSHE